ncbi:MAG: phage tail assembly protein [Methylocella sp.]
MLIEYYAWESLNNEHTFLKDTPRVKTIQLEWPVEVDGKEYREICIKRLTAGEVAVFLKEIKDAGDDKDVRLPVFVAADGKQTSTRRWMRSTMTTWRG